ncbi:hypothetical protein D3C72_2254320 [compost metagenome]
MVSAVGENRRQGLVQVLAQLDIVLAHTDAIAHAEKLRIVQGGAGELVILAHGRVQESVIGLDRALQRSVEASHHQIGIHLVLVLIGQDFHAF